MALVGGRWFVVYDLVESSGKSCLKRFEINAPADYAAAVAAEAALRPDFAAVTGMAIRSMHLYQEYVEASLAYPSGVEKENEALLALEISGAPNKTATIAIPGALDTIFVAATGPNRDIVDTADAAVVAFVANFTSGVFSVSDGEQAENLIGGVRRHLKNARS